MVMKKVASKAEVTAGSLLRPRRKYVQSLMVALFVCLFFIAMELPVLFKPWRAETEQEKEEAISVGDLDHVLLQKQTPRKLIAQKTSPSHSSGRDRDFTSDSGMVTDYGIIHSGFSTNPNSNLNLNLNSPASSPSSGKNPKGKRSSALMEMAKFSWERGGIIWENLKASSNSTQIMENRSFPVCPESVAVDGTEFTVVGKNYMAIPCGLSVGSSITVVGKMRASHWEHHPSIGRPDDESSASEVSQFVFELHGESEGEGWPSPTLLHLNPRLKGDWSNLSVIEENSCFGGQWGTGQRCEGARSPNREGTVDGLVKCEGWLENSEEKQKSSWWLHRLVGVMEKTSTNLQYPFSPQRAFVLTIRTGWEGYHTNVDGRHITSFPYRTEFWEETAGLSIHGDVDILSVIATSLPSSHPNPAAERFSEMWKAPPLPKTTVFLFIGILSASDHFAERMAIRKTWMHSTAIRKSEVVPRFFVALHQNNEINLQMKEEAKFYGDMVIVPFMDHYDLVVLKTLAICEYGVKNLSANYIMKCDDDTFVRLDAVLNEVKKHGSEDKLYLGNINVGHRPLRTGKWAVTLDEWPDDAYPPYANGPGYIISRSIARAIVSRHHKRDLELFKMEDVSMGLWLRQLNETEQVKYVHTWRFCQDGCANGCLTTHYQSPRQMLCMWKKILRGAAAICCRS